MMFYYLRTMIVNLCFVGRPGEWVLVDTGIAGSAGSEAAEELYGDGAKPMAILLTHGHFDHIGAAEELVKRWDVPIFAHEAEMPFLTGKSSYPPADPTVIDGLMAKVSPLFPRDPVDLSPWLKPLPADGRVPFQSDWQWILASGHTPGQVVFFRAKDRVLIAGDAFTTVRQESAWAVITQEKEIHGLPSYFTMNWEKVGESIKKLWELNPAVVINGHGQPMQGSALQEELKKLSMNFSENSTPDHGRYVQHPIPMGDMGEAYSNPDGPRAE